MTRCIRRSCGSSDMAMADVWQNEDRQTDDRQVGKQTDGARRVPGCCWLATTRSA
jgi:hypothetical protein